MQVCIGGPAGLALVSSQNENEETRIDLSDLQTGPREKGGCWRGRTLPTVLFSLSALLKLSKLHCNETQTVNILRLKNVGTLFYTLC